MDYADTGGGNNMHGGYTHIIIKNTSDFINYNGEISYEINPKKEGDVIETDNNLLNEIL